MKLLNLTKASTDGKETTISLLPQDKEDLFAIYQIINKDDDVIFKKMITSKLDESGKKKSTDLVLLRLKIISSEFDMKSESLRYKGVTVTDDTERANIDIPVGKYFSFDIGYTYPFTIIKEDFNHYEEKILNEACHTELRSDTAAVVLQEGISHVCLLTNSSTILKQKIEYSMPKKKRSTDVLKFDDKTEKFYKATYEAIKKNFDFDKLKIIILCSPGFYAKTLFEKIIQYSQEEQNKTVLNNKSKFLVAHSSTGYLQGISEVLKNPSYSTLLRDTKYTKEAIIIDEFLQHLNDDDFKAWYGEQEIFKAAEMGAIETLLITDTMLRSDDVSKRKQFLELVDNVEKLGGNVFVFSELHSSGEELNKLTGVACILKYPLPDLDEDLE
ncbi:hypothetical protein Kpol_1050p5 [Vanderwaltozyma polyspora DSM 70294]|uniref:Protein DOM34 homolog n=1 Tax=Vanderwaltozyma polyspora (strain ATCC 22028 / DSM 70294 / BCRC 21397 / CBS 2163 / NBRC 10782 / NRRL Y-8283 / UCD 57-17) TaxID=436907 RepID=A7TEQ2_VANPO|nr:uncharacterized protein Kpol_1050p5 [Vanderwaltozyma polyspora DSM 70294]EDO19148.1 hypothetical protein Kpol_1050p5 [Vanderwaltozyma polyspora DSM 70294]